MTAPDMPEQLRTAAVQPGDRVQSGGLGGTVVRVDGPFVYVQWDIPASAYEGL